MNKKRLILIISLVLVVIVAMCCYFKYARKISTDGKIDLAIEEVDKQQETHGAAIFEDDNIDVNMLGIWKHSIDTGWHKVYTTEPADSNCCWGREWNTSEDVFEEDLIPYGNGWFKWRKNDNELIEFHTLEHNTTVIPIEYKVAKLDNERMELKEKIDKQKHTFYKSE